MRGLRALVAAQLAAIAVCAAAVVVDFPVWALVDEAAHYDYVQWIAEDGRLPVLDEDPVHPEVLAIEEGTYPAPPRVSAGERGLFGRSYEGFQPPLSYLVASPVFAVAGDHERKLRALRALGVVLLAAAVFLTWMLARRVMPDAPLAGFSLALTFFLWPGVVVRAATFSTAALELVAGAALSLALWRALSERSSRWLVAAGALTGLALLTKLTLIAFAPALGVVCLAFLRERRVRPVVGALALPAAMLAPWLAFNLDHYGALTGSDEVQALTEPSLNPGGIEYGPGDLPAKHVTLLNGVLPDEWWVEFLSTAKRRLRDVLVGLVIAVPLLASVRMRPAERRRALAVLLLPLLAGIALMSLSLLTDNWDAFYPRYLHCTLPGFGIFAGLGLRRAIGERALVWSSVALTALLLALWAHLSTVSPATL
ncbi:MAG: glycosyltransferase family 39 protein [Thermoleophilaceae bacterium]